MSPVSSSVYATKRLQFPTIKFTDFSAVPDMGLIHSSLQNFNNQQLLRLRDKKLYLVHSKKAVRKTELLEPLPPSVTYSTLY